MDRSYFQNIRVGIGYDVHPFEEGKDLYIGGIKIPYPKGLKGHSDGDVLIHAISDALLGASGLYDIGYYFPNSDINYKGISSIIILEKVRSLLEERKIKIINIDGMIIAEEPKILPYREAIIERISSTLGIEKSSVNIKATTNEGLGFIGRKGGIAAIAVVLIAIG